MRIFYSHKYLKCDNEMMKKGIYLTHCCLIKEAGETSSVFNIYIALYTENFYKSPREKKID